MRRRQLQLGARVAGVAVAAAGLLASLWTAIVGLRWLGAGLRTARFGYRLIVLRAYRRCPDCRRVLRREARVCRSCGARVRP